MKIDSTTPPPATPPKPRLQNATNTGAAASAASDAPVTTHLQQTGTVSSAAAPFDSQRVADIRQAIAEGRFQIDANKIADRLINDVRDLLAKDRPTA